MFVLEKKPSLVLFTLINELLSNQQIVRIKVTGSSMFPFLRNQNDSIELCSKSYVQLRTGDILLLKRYNGHHVLHRLIKKKIDNFFVSGDAQSKIEGPLYPDQLIAVVSAVWRGNKRISCTNPWWRILSLIWLLLLPYRVTILKIAKKTKDILGV